MTNCSIKKKKLWFIYTYACIVVCVWGFASTNLLVSQLGPKQKLIALPLLLLLFIRIWKAHNNGGCLHEKMSKNSFESTKEKQ